MSKHAHLVVAAFALSAIARPALGERRSSELTLLGERPSTRGTVILWPGFSRTPRSLERHARSLFRAGYDVIVAPLEGHAHAALHDGDTRFVPTASAADDYLRSAERIVARARRRGGPLIFGGVSTGANVALLMAARHANARLQDGRPMIERVVAMSPFFKRRAPRIGPLRFDLADVLDLGDRLTHGRLDHLYNRIRIRFQDGETGGPAARFAFQHVSLSKTLAPLRLGRWVATRAERLRQVPIDVVISDADHLADPVESARMARRLGARLTRFHADLKVPHAMDSGLSEEMERRLFGVLAGEAGGWK